MMATGGGGTNVGRRRSTDAPAMSPERSGGTEEEAAVRGGQLFGHLAGRGGGNSTGSGGYGSADDIEMFFPEGMSREDSGGWSELAFGLELSGVGGLLKRDTSMKAEEPSFSRGVLCLLSSRLTHVLARCELN